jgi:ATP-dependent protease ClpP protease subunit
MYNDPKLYHNVDAYIDGDIGDVDQYRNLLQFLRQMEEGDEIRIWIDSPGGYLRSALAIIDAINNCKGNVTCIVSGEAFSAASMIALAAPNLNITENATMMIHNASGGIEGKFGDIQQHVEFYGNRIKTITRNIYSDFLTDEEMDFVLMGKDYYFDYDEIIKRLESRAEKQQKRIDEAKGKTEEKPKVKPRKTKSDVTVA